MGWFSETFHLQEAVKPLADSLASSYASVFALQWKDMKSACPAVNISRAFQLTGYIA